MKVNEVKIKSSNEKKSPKYLGPELLRQGLLPLIKKAKERVFFIKRWTLTHLKLNLPININLHLLEIFLAAGSSFRDGIPLLSLEVIEIKTITLFSTFFPSQLVTPKDFHSRGHGVLWRSFLSHHLPLTRHVSSPETPEVIREAVWRAWRGVSEEQDEGLWRRRKK